MEQWQKAMLEAVNLERKRLYHNSKFEKYRVTEHVSLIYSEGLSIFMKNVIFCLFSLVSLLGDDHLNIIYLLRYIKLFIESC